MGGCFMVSRWFESSATFKRETATKLIFILLCQLDLFLTLLALYLGLTEINPFVRFLITVPGLLILVKMIIPVLIAWIMPGKLLFPSIAVLALVFLWNVKELVVFLA
jgi:hypothetical protein